MPQNKYVSIDLEFDCSSETERPWDVADRAIDRINNFLSNEPAGSDAQERFNSENGSLLVCVHIPVPDIAYAATIETKLINNFGNFPPAISWRFNYVNVPIAVIEGE